MRFTQKQTRTYIAEQAAELAKLAAGAKLKEVARLLELAALQANNAPMAELKPKKAAQKVASTCMDRV
jgi:phage terminase Nu1 subunit (DNA packaging protein)